MKRILTIIIEMPLLKNKENHPGVCTILNILERQIARDKKKKSPRAKYMTDMREDILDALFAAWSDEHREFYEETPFRTGNVQK